MISLLHQMDRSLKGHQRKIKLYGLGGTVLVMQELRPSSKDVDFIVSREDFRALGGLILELEKKEKIRIDIFPDGDMPDFRYPDYDVNAEKVPLHFVHFDLYHLDKADMVLLKALAGRKVDYEDIQALAPAMGKEIPMDILMNRFKRIMPTHGKAGALKKKFELFMNVWYKDLGS